MHKPGCGSEQKNKSVHCRNSITPDPAGSMDRGDRGRSRRARWPSVSGGPRPVPWRARLRVCKGALALPRRIAHSTSVAGGPGAVSSSGRTDEHILELGRGTSPGRLRCGRGAAHAEVAMDHAWLAKVGDANAGAFEMFLRRPRPHRARGRVRPCISPPAAARRIYRRAPATRADRRWRADRQGSCAQKSAWPRG